MYPKVSSTITRFQNYHILSVSRVLGHLVHLGSKFWAFFLGMFCNANPKQKQENIQKRALRFLYDDDESTYEELLHKAKKPTIEIRKLRTLATEIFKTINNLNPPYMKEIFTQNTIRNTERKRLLVKATNTKRYGTDSLKHLGPKIWNCLPQDIKDSSSLFIFKSKINTWSGPSCNCAACS